MRLVREGRIRAEVEGTGCGAGAAHHTREVSPLHEGPRQRWWILCGRGWQASHGLMTFYVAWASALASHRACAAACSTADFFREVVLTPTAAWSFAVAVLWVDEDVPAHEGATDPATTFAARPPSAVELGDIASLRRVARLRLGLSLEEARARPGTVGQLGRRGEEPRRRRRGFVASEQSERPRRGRLHIPATVAHLACVRPGGAQTQATGR